ncbi:MAG TPA: glycosyltransferase family 2 protein [Nanoarchaeota archaeon]|nr:glycosyltransferase family 2 protein [Candidatus Woesearchaeota archaeon]HIH59012.1 glycosyltransferase family 2 protein [Nanoarchaeota archaeon]HIJ04977.1 glycosyltransferase family 2 protein [Nanoarchaeota archaeon]
MKCFPVYLMTNVDYSVVVPVYNSEESLSELHHRLVPVFEKLHQDFELILIDDGSRDKSWEVMQKLHEKYKRVKIVQLMKNFGQNNALMCGLNFASGNRMIIMDDDLQHLPEEIPKLISKMDEGYDVVYGKYLKKKHVWYRNIASTLVYGSFSKMIGLKMKVSAFKIINRQVVNEIIKFKSQNPHIDIYIARVLSPQRISNVIVRHASRKYGETNYNFWTLSKWALDILFNFTTYPLTLAIIIGFFFSIFSFFLAFLYFISYFLTDIHVSGFTTLILAVTFFSGIILFVIGIIGRYIGSIFLDVNNKPQFVIRNVKK